MPETAVIRWNGGPAISDLTVGDPQLSGRSLDYFCVSHFAHGILTFHLPFVFRTAPGWALLMTGPFNEPRDGITPLAGVIETDWAPFPATMNWQCTRPGAWVFEKGATYAQVLPVPLTMIRGIQPVVRPITADPTLHKELTAFVEKREAFNYGLKERDPEISKEGWQRHYFRGVSALGAKGPSTHLTKLRLNEPEEKF